MAQFNGIQSGKLKSTSWSSNISTKLHKNGFITVGEEACVIPSQALQHLQQMKSFKVRDDDVWIITFPKSGTTWAQEMAWCIAHNCDFKAADTIPLDSRSTFFEAGCFNLVEVEGNDDPLDILDASPSPRIIKSHLPFQLLPKQLQSVIEGKNDGPKIIYVYRNPKAVCVSFFHHCKILDGFSGTLEQFVDAFIHDSIIWAPFWKHVAGFWERRANPNVLFLKYSDMKMNLQEEVENAIKFLGKDELLAPETIAGLSQHLTFDEMSKNRAVNKVDIIQKFEEKLECKSGFSFLRKGQLDSWKTDLSPELVDKLDLWEKENGILELAE